MKHTLFITLLFLSCSSTHHKLKFDLSTQPNKSYQLHISRETTTKFQNHFHSDATSMEMELHTLSKKDTLNTIQLTFNKITLNSPQRFIRLNNQFIKESDLNSTRDSMLAAIKGTSIHVLINEKGITQKIKNLDEVFKTIAQRTGRPISTVKYLLADFMGEDAIKDNLNRIFSTVATRQIIPGENWGSSLTLTSKAPININSLYTLTKLQSDSAFINIHSTIRSRAYLNGEQNGTVVLNYKTGMPYKYETTGQTITHTSSYDTQEIEHFLAIIK